ncbi:MAG: DUF2924 domain-containing protein [Steroidobacteraceae bacterium]
MENESPPYHWRFLEHRLAYRIQELAYGGLKPETLRRLRDLAEESSTVATRSGGGKSQRTGRLLARGSFVNSRASSTA